MKRIAGTLIVLLVLLYSLRIISFAEEKEPTKMINVVFDDSGSMIYKDGKKVDTWCQAKYAMEVFAAMLGNNDTMNIYFMSDFSESKKNSTPKLTLNGNSGSDENVRKVHEMVTQASNTPFNSVRKAMADLNESDSDEKWLVVLTDGAFQGVDDIDLYFAGKADNINVLFLGIGADASEIKTVESSHIFFEKANSNDEILEKITNMSSRIFNNHKLNVDVNSKRVSFDIPMRELIVFAQGENVTISGIKKTAGAASESDSGGVVVKYSEIASLGSNAKYADPLIDTRLQGRIVSFVGDYDVGEYDIVVENAETLEVYYKPNVEIAAYLLDKQGNEVTDFSKLENGEYIIEFGFVKTGTNEKVVQSQLLGEVTYSAVIRNNGEMLNGTYASGDTISIQEGTLDIDVVARFLEYSEVSTSLNYSIYRNREIGFESISSPEFNVRLNMDSGINIFKWYDYITEDGTPLVLHLTVDGREFTQSEWESLEQIKCIALNESSKHYEISCQKSENVGEVLIYTMLKPRKWAYLDEYRNVEYELTAYTKHGDELWSGVLQDSLKINDHRLLKWVARIWKTVVCLLILLLILGYVPPFKKYLPKNLVSRPLIECDSKDFRLKPPNPYAAKVSRKRTFTPYAAERATITIRLKNTSNSIPPLRVEAMGGNKMQLKNTKDFVDKENVDFGGQRVESGDKNIRIFANTTINIETEAIYFKCTLNKK